MKFLFIYSLFFSFIAFIMLSCHAKNENENRDLIEIIKDKDSTIVYMERLNNEQALLYRSIYPDVLFFVKTSDSCLYEVDSIIDFNHDFTMYRTEVDLVKEMGNITEIDISKIDFNKWGTYSLNRKNQLNNPRIGRFGEDLFVVDNNNIYELSLSKRTFNKVIYYYMALDMQDSCIDNSLTRLSNPQKNIYSSLIRVSFQDESFFELTPKGLLNIQVVDSNSCLKIDGDFNNVHMNYEEGKGCSKGTLNLICE